MNVCEQVKEDLEYAIRPLVQETLRDNKERGFAIWQTTSGHFTTGPKCRGERCSIRIQRFCLEPTHRLVGDFHTHPRFESTDLLEPKDAKLAAQAQPMLSSEDIKGIVHRHQLKFGCLVSADKPNILHCLQRPKKSLRALVKRQAFDEMFGSSIRKSKRLYLKMYGQYVCEAKLTR